MKTNERMHLITLMMEDLESSVDTYCKVKETRGVYPVIGYGISKKDCKESIKRRITLIREELLNISKELKEVL